MLSERVTLRERVARGNSQHQTGLDMMRYGGESHDAARARPCPAAVTLPCREAAQIPARSVTHREDRGPAFEMGALALQ